MNGSFAYVAAFQSDSLMVFDISNPASPVIRGSVVSSSLLDVIREARSCGADGVGRRTFVGTAHRAHTRGATAC